MSSADEELGALDQAEGEQARQGTGTMTDTEERTA